MDGRLISTSANRAFGRDDGDVLRNGSGDRRLRARFDDADDRQRGMLQTQGVERGC